MNLILLSSIFGGIILLGVLIACSYVKCPPDMVFIISGLRKKPRVIIGKATLRIPFFERVDKLTLELIQVAARHFLNQNSNYIAANVQQVLEGNMREIIGQMNLVALVNDKQLFSQKIQENASDDIKNIGLEIVNLNVQSCTDDNQAIENLGIDNLVKIQKAAKIAKAQAEKEIKVAEAAADEEGARARAEADAKIAEQQKNLAIKTAEYKIEQDRKKADADAAYEIQKAVQQKTINENSFAFRAVNI